jgi:hypothetical protein
MKPLRHITLNMKELSLDRKFHNQSRFFYETENISIGNKTNKFFFFLNLVKMEKKENGFSSTKSYGTIPPKVYNDEKPKGEKKLST